MSRTWITRTEVLERLAVKPQTLYAYVSRGRIAARPDPEDPRRSLYAVEDVCRLADRAPRGGARRPPLPGGQASRGEAVVDSGVSAVVDGTVYYRGRDAIELAETATLEQAARLLWGGEEDPFADQRPRIDVLFPGAARARLFAALARRAEEDAASAGRSERSLRREAASLLNELVDAVAGGTGPRLYLHQRLARAWKLDDRGAQVIRRALVLSADGELNTTALAVRVAASTGASLAASAMAGLSALSSPQFAGRLAQVGAYLAETPPGADPRLAARQRLAQGLDLPGFGDQAFPRGDRRARALMEAAGLSKQLWDVAQVGEGLTGEAANFDLALALVGRRLDLPKDGPFTLLALGRICGWLAHAMEQATEGVPIRARLRYVGPEPA